MIRTFFALTLAFGLGLAFPAAADEVKVGDLLISKVWAQASPGQPRNGAVFMTIINKGKTADSLTEAFAPVAEKTLLHKSAKMSGLLKMYWVGEIEINPGKPLKMKEDGHHVMLVALKDKLKVGQTFPLTLNFEKAGKTELQVVVKKGKRSSTKPEDREKTGR